MVFGVIPALLCITLHELSHGAVAYSLGDDTAKRQGRLTLNPIRHIDIMGLLMMVFFRFGWAKPVPVNPLNFRRNGITMRGGMALTAAAGPLSNLILGLIFFLICKIALVNPALPYALVQVTLMVSQINIMLAVFNLLPVYPMDGGRIFSYFLPDRFLYFVEEHQQKIQLIFMALVLFTPILDVPLGYAQYAVLKLFDMLTAIGGFLPQVL